MKSSNPNTQTKQGTTTYKRTAPPTNPATECGYTNPNTKQNTVMCKKDAPLRKLQILNSFELSVLILVNILSDKKNLSIAKWRNSENYNLKPFIYLCTSNLAGCPRLSVWCSNEQLSHILGQYKKAVYAVFLFKQGGERTKLSGQFSGGGFLKEEKCLVLKKCKQCKESHYLTVCVIINDKTIWPAHIKC